MKRKPTPIVFGINWPPMFKARTSDKKDPCYIGRLTAVPAPVTPNQCAWSDKRGVKA